MNMVVPMLRSEVRAADVDDVRRLVTATGVFRADEVDIAVELAQDAAHRGPASDYRFFFVDGAAGAIGYSCYGRIGCTLGSYDLYWIVVDPAHHGQGIGRRLLRATETAIAELGGRRIYVETSSLPGYEAARRFYVTAGYDLIARLPEFYAPGDDKCIYCRTVSPLNR
ncbi:MAG: GNAT family N-acetyltransferase [Phycisphaerales bacterium]|nr:GNAT family N-acetyltransferase [Phycisphaerales bacterium]